MRTADIAIIGSGPAGLSAAITGRSRNKQVLVVSNHFEQSPLARAERIDNYPGVPEINGISLLVGMQTQASVLGAEFRFDRVISIMPFGTHFGISTGSDMYEVGSVILAIGTQSAKAYSGEAEFLGRGVSYCATCDGMLYRGKSVVVVGLNEESVDEANFLADIGCQVTFITSLDKDLSDLAADILVHRAKVQAIVGDEQGINAISIMPFASEDEVHIDTQGVFILRPAIAPAALLPGLEMADAFIEVEIATLATSVPGVFAAGDCIGKPLQIAKAVGQGQQAAFSAIAYLENLQKPEKN